MRFDKIMASEKLRPFIKYFVISENTNENIYKVFPSTALVIGFQYKGKLTLLDEQTENLLTGSGITGLSDSYKVFKNTAGIGTILIYFTETGIAHFSNSPAHEIFNQSISLDNLFDKKKVTATEEKLFNARTDEERIKITERFLGSEIKDKQEDKLIVEAVRMIYASKGSIKIKELNEKLFISQSPFEKRFRKIVGTTPKKFSSIVRFNAVMDNIASGKSLTDLCYEYNFFDQAPFYKRL